MEQKQTRQQVADPKERIEWIIVCEDGFFGGYESEEEATKAFNEMRKDEALIKKYSKPEFVTWM